MGKESDKKIVLFDGGTKMKKRIFFIVNNLSGGGAERVASDYESGGAEAGEAV